MRTRKRNPTKVRLKSKTQVFDGHIDIDRYRLTHELYDGGWGALIEREVMSRGNSVAVLLFDPYRQEVVLIEQFRIGAWVAHWANPWLLECVAGLIEPGEKSTAVAIRESLEESGCSVTRLTSIANYLSTPGCSSEEIEIFCGQIDATGVGGNHGIEDEGEDIRASVWNVDDALDILDKGRICNAMTIIALQWLSRHRERLTHHWTAEPVEFFGFDFINREADESN